ncbi:LuxR C-terminal-related transcriptional regulator [Gramella sp. GC03-9]|uniref:LuxR C-terminal-related transcriptional regulator n=1 Tax=Christiangramia oceanisediminis TaxID=2920386 RepID=A0A9X2I9I6_9FLAO|nr:LuxR C-terminal-related transcriptional regulator [Gramella oceanisediminis]MCP9198483.1 LuxR C-terminal-related transcriptional regulator [Gramella oceanisediminis]
MEFKTPKILILLCLNMLMVSAQELVPPIQNYSPAEYSGASQNWDISIDDRGIVYTANNQGLLVYDGFNWNLYPLESQSIIRSVYPFKGKIFTGSYKEFGYWEHMPEGCLNYISLSGLLKDLDLQNDEFWEITSYKDDIYFRSFGGVFRYSDNKIERIKEVVSTAFGIFQDKLIIAPRNKGLAYLDSEANINELPGDLSPILNMNIVDLEAIGEKLFIAGKEVLFVYENGELQKFWNEELNELLVKNELNHMEVISENELVLATIKNGIIHFDLSTDEFQVYNRTSGLQNNTVLGLKYAREKLWLALDKGVDMIDLKSPFKFYTNNSGELGAVYDLEIFQDDIYLASNTGVYQFKDGNLNLIENAEDHTWNLELIDEVLYANHNTGLFKIQGGSFIPIDNHTGSFTVKKMPEDDRLVIGHYTGISLYHPGTGELNELNTVNFPVKQIVFENPKTAWAAHPYEGIYRLDLSDLNNVKVDKIEPLADNANFNSRVYKVNNQIMAYVADRWFVYNSFKDSFEEFKELSAYHFNRLIHKNDRFVFVDSEDGSIVITDLDDKEIRITGEELNQRLVKSNENYIPINDSISLITLNDGFARINLNQLKRSKENVWISTPIIKELLDERIRYSIDDDLVIPYKHSRNISLKVGLPVSDAVDLEYALTGEDDLNGTVQDGSLNFQNLGHGDYHLTLKAIGSEPGQLTTASLDFSIAPPWYLSFWMKLLYGLIIIGIVYLLYWFNQQKLQKHQLQLEEKFEQEHTERLNRIEKERLMNEIDLKRKELANTTMMAAKKNEVLMEIQNELNKDKSRFSNQFRLKHIMNKINTAVKNKDEWKVFETNFNEVHEDFFKEVLDQYPKLTNKDLKLCSYLKMNLSSKEIAPLMGISVRGVEVHRYRLRKKMRLDSNVNLTKFLIKNF